MLCTQQLFDDLKTFLGKGNNAWPSYGDTTVEMSGDALCISILLFLLPKLQQFFLATLSICKKKLRLRLDLVKKDVY